MTDEQLSTTLRAWLRQRDALPQDPERTAAHVLARLPSVRQRRRWWLLPSLGRAGRRPTPEPSREPTGDEPSVDRFPIVTRRTVTMLSPVKAITAGALTLALASLYLVAHAPDPQASGVPGAEMMELQGISVAATMECVDAGDAPDVCTWTASDPRLTGTAAGRFTGDVSDDRPGEGLRTGLSWLDHALEGPEGSWSGHEYFTWTEPLQHFIVLSGSGAYEGWHYVASATTESGPPIDWTGVLYEGELPPFGPLTAAVGD